MKISKVILGSVIILHLTTELSASRTKKDLLPKQEEEIVSLLKEKIAIVDKLIIEAKIYKNEIDPLIQKDFFNLPTGFVSYYRKRDQYIYTDTDTSRLIKKERTNKLPTSNKIGVPNAFNRKKTREIFNINMKQKGLIKTSLSNNINYLYTLSYALGNVTPRKMGFPKEKLLQMIDNDISKTIQPLAIELLEKYIKFMYHLSQNPIREHFIKTQRTDTLTKVLEKTPIQKWSIYSKMIKFKFALDRNNPYFKKKNYDLSEVMNELFNSVHSKEGISLTSTPSYYDRRETNRKLRCIETAKDIKYKGRICINPIDVDKDIYFDYGIFETRENNFLQTNKKHIDSLNELNKKLVKASKKYIKFFIIELTSPTPKKDSKVNLEGGL